MLVCRKLYHGALKEEGFVDRQVMEESYPNRDFHTMYVGEIVGELDPKATTVQELGLYMAGAKRMTKEGEGA